MLIVESDIENYLKKRVKHFGGRCIKLMATFEEGIPDRLVLLPKGVVAFVELKRPKGGKLSDVQIYQHGKLRDLGCKVYVVKNYDEVNKMLEELNDIR